MKIERAFIDKTREFPEWLLRAIGKERAELAAITDPVKRRMAELDLEEIETRVKTELSGAH